MTYPGYRRVPLRGGAMPVSATGFPLARTSGRAYQGTHELEGMGQHPQEHEDFPAFKGMIEVPAFYTVSIDLGGAVNATAGNSTPIRPEPFICRRITWATSGDAPVFISVPTAGSAQGRVVEVSWSDEFTKFLGNQPCLISALFGDSNGFLDLPKRGLLFQGRQVLSVQLHRLIWPDPESSPADTRFDFSFQGVMLLPEGVNQSGSAG